VAGPVILSITPRGDGYAVAVVSVAPGRRVQLVVLSAGLTDAQLRDNVLVLANATQRKGNP